MGLLMAQGKRSTWWHLAVISDGEKLNDYRDALKHRAKGDASDDENKLLDQIGLPSDARGSIPELLESRHNLLNKKENQFVTNLNLKWKDAA